MNITPAQLRAARALIDWTRKQLSVVAGVSPETIKNIERGTLTPTPGTVEKVTDALSANGVEFLIVESQNRFSVGTVLTAEMRPEGSDEHAG
jgi:transcriptional regulator with XRE-family HTH domain